MNICKDELILMRANSVHNHFTCIIKDENINAKTVFLNVNINL